MLLAVWGMCSSFYITRAITGRKKNNDSSEKRQSARLDLAAKKILFRVFALKMVSGKTKEYVKYVTLVRQSQIVQSVILAVCMFDVCIFIHSPRISYYFTVCLRRILLILN